MSTQPLLPRDPENDEDEANVLKASCCCCCCFVGAFCVFQIAFMAACLAFSCFLFLITGHAMLRFTDIAVYSDFSIQSSMQVGAAGGAILLPALLVLAAIEDCLKTESMQNSLIDSVAVNMLSLGRSTATGAAAGWAGSKVLLSHGYTVMDPWHAGWAGALGGAVLGPCIIIGTIIFTLIIVSVMRGR